MILFEYDGVMKRYNVKVPFTLAGESSMVTVAAISEDERIITHRELSLKLMHQIILQWEEKVHMDTMKIAREELDDNELFSEQDKEYARWELQHDLAKSVDELEFCARTDNCLMSKGIRTVAMLVDKKPSDLFKIKNFGRKSLTEVEEKLNELGLTLKQ